MGEIGKKKIEDGLKTNEIGYMSEDIRKGLKWDRRMTYKRRPKIVAWFLAMGKIDVFIFI